MSLAEPFAQYLSQSFRPIRVTAPILEWRKLCYQNPLFEVVTHYHKTNEYESVEQLKTIPNLSFNASFFPYINKRFMVHPLTYLKSIRG